VRRWQDLAETFADCDADGDQRIDFAEFLQLLGNPDSEAQPAQPDAKFDEIDSDRNGATDRSDLMEWWRGS
jgi:Ca2+-binding EF-hand superfamily protein